MYQDKVILNFRLHALILITVTDLFKQIQYNFTKTKPLTNTRPFHAVLKMVKHTSQDF